MDKKKEEGRKANRLIEAKSPYLQQHAHNPVDWYPWGDEAFDRARQEDKPIFLSIGYASCHWCHVMERESFDNPEIAGLLNDNFVCIKVDREERPDVDQLYMNVSQLVTGRGGWPLTIMMTPEKKPFFAATYIPPDTRQGSIGMRDLIPRLGRLWREKRGDLLYTADQITQVLGRQPPSAMEQMPDLSLLTKGYEELTTQFDTADGGFGDAPKFPQASHLLFLLRYWRRAHSQTALMMVIKTLESMARGGIHDQLGSGFHRYATDSRWIVPHFEKMLYDQALLAMVYTEAYQATHQEDLGRTARSILAYVLREMSTREGGFASAEDADSEEEEGKFYLWTKGEIEALLPPEEAELFCHVYNVREEGNYWEPGTNQPTGKNILYRESSLEDEARGLQMEPLELKTLMDRARRRLFLARGERVRPFKDDKVLTDWNGLMIAALAKAGQVFDDPAYTLAAEKAAVFILERMRNRKGELLHRYRDGEAGIHGLSDDYAFFIWGLLDLYELTFRAEYLSVAMDLHNIFVKQFWDSAGAGFFSTPEDSQDLPVRKKEIHDSALPSTNAVALLNMLRLGRMTGDPLYEKQASALGAAFARTVRRAVMGHTFFLSAVDMSLGPCHEVVLAGNPGSPDAMAMIRSLRDHYLPCKVVLFRPTSEASPLISRLAEFTSPMRMVDGQCTAYVCTHFSCASPTNNRARMLSLLGVGE